MSRSVTVETVDGEFHEYEIEDKNHMTPGMDGVTIYDEKDKVMYFHPMHIIKRMIIHVDD